MDIPKLVRFGTWPREGKTVSRRIPPGLLALGVVVLLAACGAQAASPRAILDAYAEAIAAADAEAALAVFADDALVMSDSRNFYGKRLRLVLQENLLDPLRRSFGQGLAPLGLPVFVDVSLKQRRVP